MFCLFPKVRKNALQITTQLTGTFSTVQSLTPKNDNNQKKKKLPIIVSYATDLIDRVLVGLPYLAVVLACPAERLSPRLPWPVLLCAAVQHASARPPSPSAPPTARTVATLVCVNHYTSASVR